MNIWKWFWHWITYKKNKKTTNRPFKLFNREQIILLMLDSNTWNHLTVCKQMRSGLFKILPTNYSFTTHISYIYQPLRSGRIWHKVNFFKQSLTCLNSVISFSLSSCLPRAEEPSLPYYLPIAGGRIIGCIPFPMVLVLCEMQSVSSRIWTRVAASIYNGHLQNSYIHYICIKRINKP